MKLLFVCTGNICRSPTAEGVVKYICKKNNLKTIHCDSAALYNYHIGDTPDARAIETAKNYGVNIQNIRARKINLNDINVFDMIIGMDKNHITKLKEIFDNNNKIYMYLNFTEKFKNQDVPDPYYGTMQNFEQTYKLIKIGAEEIVKKFSSKNNFTK